MQIMSVRSAVLELEAEELYHGQHLHVYQVSNGQQRLVAFVEVLFCPLFTVFVCSFPFENICSVYMYIYIYI